MCDDFKREEVIELAEIIFAHHTRISVKDKVIEQDAKLAIKAAMIFRKAEKEIFEEKK